MNCVRIFGGGRKLSHGCSSVQVMNEVERSVASKRRCMKIYV